MPSSPSLPQTDNSTGQQREVAGLTQRSSLPADSVTGTLTRNSVETRGLQAAQGSQNPPPETPPQSLAPFKSEGPLGNSPEAQPPSEASVALTGGEESEPLECNRDWSVTYNGKGFEVQFKLVTKNRMIRYSYGVEDGRPFVYDSVSTMRRSFEYVGSPQAAASNAVSSLRAIIDQGFQPDVAKLHMPGMLDASWDAVYDELWRKKKNEVVPNS
jgi:hypothetical protein